MRISGFSMYLLVALCCLLMCSSAHAQQAFGYATITYDEGTDTATGYASTEVDYETAYYYDAEVQAHIEDENGNVLGSGSGTGNPSALTFFDVIHAALCLRISIISFVIVAPHFLGCDNNYFDFFGFSDYWWGWYWDFGDFSLSRRNRCIFGRLIFIATIISDFIRCLPADVACEKDTNQLLPSGLRANIETPYLTGLIPNNNDSDHVTIRCRATNPVTNSGQSGITIHFGFGNVFTTDGGHQNHVGARPQGSYSRTAVRTDSNGDASSVYTAPIFGGTTRIVITASGTDDHADADMEIKVPALASLAVPAATDGYVRVGSSESGNTYHPNGHFGTAAANTGLQQIAADYRGTAFPQPQFPNGQPEDRKLRYNDQSLIWGGKFDITPSFNAPPPPSWRDGAHSEHRVGINCDVRLGDVPNENVVINGQNQNRRTVLESIFFNRGSTDTLREFSLNHWHLRFEFNNPPAVAVVGSVPADGVPASVPGVIEAERFDSTGNDGTAGSFVPGTTDPNFPGIIYNNPQVIPITGNEDQSYVPTAGGQWMNYTVNVGFTGSYSFEARVASLYGGNTFHVEVDGVDRTGSISIPNTGSGDVYQFITVNDIWLDAGQRVVRVVTDGAGSGKGNFDYFTINPYYPPQFCDPQWWELQECQNGGGYWDYGLCTCHYQCQFGICEAQ